MFHIRSGKNYDTLFSRVLMSFMIIFLMAILIIPFGSETVQAETLELADDHVYEDVRDFKAFLNEEMLANTQWVEITFEKDGVAVGNPLWYQAQQNEWPVDLTDFEGDYTAKIYRVDAEFQYAQPEAFALAKVDFKVGKISTGKLKVSSIVEESVTGLKVELSEVKSTYEISTLTFIFKNSKGKVVYTKKAALDENKEGCYSTSVLASKLGNKAGKYTVTAKITDINNASHTLDVSAKGSLVAASAKVKGGNKDKEAGTFTFTVSNICSVNKVKSVNATVWCKSSDKKEYKGIKKLSDGSYQVVVNAADHKYHFGTYNVKVTVVLKDGTTVTAATGECEFAPNNFVVYGDIEKNIKTVYIYNPTSDSTVYADVYSVAGKGADKETYTAADKENCLKFKFNLRKLKYAGAVKAKIYDKSGKIKTLSFNVTNQDISKNGWYYEKAGNGKTYRFYYKDGVKQKDLTKILNITNAKFRIEVNRVLNTVTVYAYDSDKKEWNTPVIAFACSVGAAGTPTPTGTYSTDRKHRWKELMGPSWGQYATHIVRGIYFHSVAGGQRSSYNINPYAYNRLGSPASHGCIRLCVRDAKWIYDHCALGTTVYIYDNSSFSGPLGKPATIKISASTHYDPTDPAIKN